MIVFFLHHAIFKSKAVKYEKIFDSNSTILYTFPFLHDILIFRCRFRIMGFRFLFSNFSNWIYVIEKWEGASNKIRIYSELAPEHRKAFFLSFLYRIFFPFSQIRSTDPQSSHACKLDCQNLNSCENLTKWNFLLPAIAQCQERLKIFNSLNYKILKYPSKILEYPFRYRSIY